MNVDSLIPHTPLFLQNLEFWPVSATIIVFIVLCLAASRMLNIVDGKEFWRVMVPTLSALTVIGVAFAGFVANDQESEKRIREQLTEHYDLRDDVFYDNVSLTSTERLQEAGRASAVSNGAVILSRYDREDGTVRLYLFEEGEAVELPAG